MLTGVTEVVVVNDRGLSAVDARELSRPDQSPGLDRGGDCCMRSCVGHINLICLRYVRCQPHPVLGSVAVHERISPAALPSVGDDLPFMSAAVAEARAATAHADVPVAPSSSGAGKSWGVRGTGASTAVTPPATPRSWRCARRGS